MLNVLDKEFLTITICNPCQWEFIWIQILIYTSLEGIYLYVDLIVLIIRILARLFFKVIIDMIPAIRL